MAEPTPEIIGRYRVLGVLGKGAMGVVYKAVDPMIDREVAIKTIRLSLSDEELALYEARFAQEIKTVGKLNHAHIVTIYDVGRTDQFAYMAMEYIEGRELKAYMAPGRPTDPATAVDLIAQVADGLAFAHARDIIHRDVKPSNIMIATDEDRMVAKIMDFGIARAPSSSVKTMTGMILGSPRYMSPEQVVGRNIGPRSDVFSLGVVLYEMLAGAAPFDAESVSSIMYQTVHVREEPPSRVNPDIPPPLDAIVARALAKDADERYPTMREFHRALREAAKGLPEPRVLEVVPPASSPAAATPALGEPPGHALGLAREFDSMAGTIRLAELTEHAGDVTTFFRRNAVAPAALATPAAAPEPASPEPEPAGQAENSGAFPLAPALLLGTLAAIATALGIALVR